MHLILDSRQRAMLAEMGVRVWLPELNVTHTSVTKAVLVKSMQDDASQSVDVAAPIAIPVRKEPPLRLPVLNSPPVQTGQPTRYVIGNMPKSSENYDCILLGEPCTGEAEKLLANMLHVIGGKVFVAHMVAAQDDEMSLVDQLQTLSIKAILVLGPHAAKAILSESARAIPFSQLRGKLHSAGLPAGMSAIVTYHPMQLLRQPLVKAQTWLDLKLLLKAMKP